MNTTQKLVSALVAMLFAPAAMASSMPQASVIDAQGRAVMDARGNCVLTKWESNESACGSLSLSKEARTVYFDFNKSSIRGSEKAKLDSLIHAIKGAKGVSSVDIVGHADRIGKSSYNSKLSRKRAEAVKAYLWHHGIKTRKVDLKAVGDKQSVTHCDPKLKRAELIACLAADRRVEIELNYAK